MKEFLKNFDKGDMYDHYIGIVSNPKKYEKITRFKMNDEMREFFLNHPEKIAEVFSLDELKKAIRISKVCKNKGVYEENMESFSLLPDSKHAFLFESYLMDGKKEIFKMVPEFSSYLSAFVIELELEEKKYFETIVKGMLLVYGGMLIEDIMSLYFKKRPSKYAGLPLFHLNDFKYFKIDLLIQGYDIYTDAMLYPLLDAENMDFKLGSIKAEYDLDTYYDFAVLGMPKRFLKKKSKVLFVYNVQEVINEELQFSNFAEIMVEDPEFLNLIQFVGIDKAVLSAWPIWRYGGLSSEKYQKSIKNQLIDESLSRPFLDYVHELVRYGNKKYKYISKNELITDVDAFEIIKKSLVRKDFLKQFHASRKEVNSEIANGFENAVIMNTAIAYKFENGKLLILHEGVMYHVSGISSSIQENIHEENLPCLVSTIVVPLKDSVTYSLSIVEYRISMSAGMLSAFESELKDSVHVRNINDFYSIQSVDLHDKH